MRLAEVTDKKVRAGTREILDIQSKLLDDEQLPDNFDVTIKMISMPKLPVISITDSTGRAVVQITPMRGMRYKMIAFELDNFFSDSYYDVSHGDEPLKRMISNAIQRCIKRKQRLLHTMKTNAHI